MEKGCVNIYIHIYLYVIYRQTIQTLHKSLTSKTTWSSSWLSLTFILSLWFRTCRRPTGFRTYCRPSGLRACFRPPGLKTCHGPSGFWACHLLVRFRLLNPSLYCRLYIKVWSFYLWGWRQCSCLLDHIFIITVTLKANVWSCSGVSGGVEGRKKNKSQLILASFTDQSQSSLVLF